MDKTFDPEVHKRYIYTLLTDIAEKTGNSIAFKGGTCAALFYKLPRFSFDLDFDVLKPIKEETFNQVKIKLLKEGDLREWTDKRFSMIGVFSYSDNCPNIKIEFNKRIWKNNTYKETLFMGTPLLIMNESSILTNKLVALTDRKNAVARDVFDTWYFLKMGYSINNALITERTNLNAKEYLTNLKKFITKQFKENTILQGLGIALNEKQKDWARKHLVQETIEAIEERITPRPFHPHEIYEASGE